MSTEQVLIGEVVDAEGNAVADVEIRIDQRDGSPFAHYWLPALGVGEYAVTTPPMTLDGEPMRFPGGTPIITGPTGPSWFSTMLAPG